MTGCALPLPIIPTPKSAAAAQSDITAIVKRFAGAKTRRWSPNGRNYRRVAGDTPLFVRWDDSTLEQLTHQERAMINFTRALPEDLRQEYLNLVGMKGDDFWIAIAIFDEHFQARRGEIVWPPESWFKS